MGRRRVHSCSNQPVCIGSQFWAGSERGSDHSKRLWKVWAQDKDRLSRYVTHGLIAALSKRLSAYDPGLWTSIASQLSQVPEIVAGIVYTDVSNLDTPAAAEIPILQHVAGQPAASLIKTSLSTSYSYPKMQSYSFATHNHSHFHYVTESVSHTRSLQFLKKLMDGPYFDLEAIWEEHTYYEFADRSVEHTMSTMVQEPYVNHVPTVSFYREYCHTGGLMWNLVNWWYRPWETDAFLPRQFHFQQFCRHRPRAY